MAKDIVQAIERENEYQKQREKGEDVKIYDFIGPCGYDDVNDFYWDKQYYLLRHQPYVVEREPYIDLGFTSQYFANKIPAILWTISCSTRYAFVPVEFTNFELLEQYGLTPLQIGYSGRNGIIISDNGDLRIFLIYPDSITVPVDYILEFFRTRIAKKYDNTIVDKNDILVAGKKVVGSAEFSYMDMHAFVVQVTFNDNGELIRKICGETEKVPGYLDPTIISPYTLKNSFTAWLGVQ